MPHTETMKWTFVLCAVFVSIALPATSFAADVEALRISVMRTLIAALNEEVQLLTKKLEVQQAASILATPHTRTIDDLKVSSFYEGDYMALYETSGAQLSPIGRQNVRPLDQAVWNRFVVLAGERYAQVNVQEFRVFSDKDSVYDAFADLDTTTGKWILGFNTYGIDFTEASVWSEIDPILVHEFGHMIVDADQDLYTAFVTQYWNDAASYGLDDGLSAGARYARFPNHFVTEYAATSPLEDCVESFVAFALEPGMSGYQERDLKRNFFFAYPALIARRATVQSGL
jgi:hypothetical protein